MSNTTHPHVKVIEGMTAAAISGDKDALAKIFTDVIGTIFALTNGDVKIEALLISADDTWATEWEHAVLGRNGQKLDTHNVFAYQFEGDRIAEMWMVCTAPAGSEAFWS